MDIEVITLVVICSFYDPESHPSTLLCDILSKYKVGKLQFLSLFYVKDSILRQKTREKHILCSTINPIFRIIVYYWTLILNPLNPIEPNP